MTGDFYAVLARIGVGCSEDGDHGLVDEFGAIGDVGVVGGICGGGRCDTATYRTDDGQGVGAADADDAESTTGSSSWGADG